MANDLRRGSIVLAVYPFIELSSAKRRRALVVSASDRPGRDCILAFTTSQAGVAEVTDLALDSSARYFAATGLRAPSVVRCSKLMTLDRSLLTGRLGQLSAHQMAEVNAHLKIALELS